VTVEEHLQEQLNRWINRTLIWQERAIRAEAEVGRLEEDIRLCEASQIPVIPLAAAKKLAAAERERDLLVLALKKLVIAIGWMPVPANYEKFSDTYKKARVLAQREYGSSPEAWNAEEEESA
jgi:hypothetical protein